MNQKEWKTVMNSNPSEKKGDNLPVNNVSWNDIQKFLASLNAQTGKQYRLPTEAEWEYAARGGVESKGFRYAGSYNVDEVAWHKYTCKNLQPVGQKKPNELGLYDMSGNVWEWCEDDWHYNYLGALSTSQAWTDNPRINSRVRRGGSWFNFAHYCRITMRDDYLFTYRFLTLGFRLAMSIS